MASNKKNEEPFDITMIAILDYSVGNVDAVQNMLRKLGVASTISSDPGQIRTASKLVLPGVGAFDAAMEALQHFGLTESVRSFASSGRPLLGICLGAQLLLSSSEEGTLPGFGFIDGNCKKFDGINPLRIPHMSWSEVSFTKFHPITNFEESAPRFYFVHSYHMVCNDTASILGTSHYGYEFASAVYRDNIIGVQFHPEKSHKYGAQFLSNFAKL